MTNLNIAELVAARQAAIEHLTAQRATLLDELPGIQAAAIQNYRDLVARVREVEEQLAQIGASADAPPIPSLHVEASPDDTREAADEPKAM